MFSISKNPVPNPAAHPAVKRYLKGVTEEQLKARAIPKQAEPIFICDLTALCQVIDSKLRSASTDQLFSTSMLVTWPTSNCTSFLAIAHQT